jgi:hypothetical protein
VCQGNYLYEFYFNAVQITPRIPPKNGAVFLPGNVIRVEFPAQGYVNPINTTFEFDVTLSTYSNPQQSVVRFQNNIQSIFSRVRLLYGATPLEDIINYNVIVRCLTEWTSTNQSGTMDQTSIAEGIAGITIGTIGSNAALGPPYVQATSFVPALVNARQAYIQGIDLSLNGFGYIPNSSCTRRYQVNLALGLLTQDKLLPVKFMASQLAIELSLAQESDCIIARPGVGTAPTGPNFPSYSVSNFNMIPEILEFDASYDSMFLRGLQDGGVPLKFSSWHTFIFTANGASINLLVQERSRSVKALFAVQRLNPSSIGVDMGATFFNSSTVLGTLQNYQFRIGGRYFPAQPVQLSTNVGGSIGNGGAEAYVELQKALNIVGDYRLSTSTNTTRWAQDNIAATVDGAVEFAQNADYGCSPFIDSRVALTPSAAYPVSVSPIAGSLGSSCFVMASDLETSNGIEISGLNAEEQSDIALLANWSAAQANGNNLEVYSYYDAMIILRENNVLELIQ